MKYSKSTQSGFTLVEIAIVLVIIGVLLAGVLKGQSLITNSRIKGLVNNMNAVSSAYNGYIDRYQATPGTETVAVATARGWTTNANGVSPLVLTPATTFAPAGSQPAFWQVLRAAGFFTGASTSVTNPPSATGGLIGVALTPYTGIPGISVCLSGLTGVQAEGVDVILDGPLPATNIGSNIGSVRGASAVANPLEPTGGAAPATAFNENLGTFWTLCRVL
ncbi:type II secretion system protein [Sapientia aquatica]|uniref:Type II secretion system protein n=1 Tax=Sapientia aquatica TaxID=1549640 RepID=A0A4R5W0W7_9BURK|nr:type II secretion system protein [Sapientia aquatica]TDK65691.1 type II secretion system protein [Sapientia aquatica]